VTLEIVVEGELIRLEIVDGWESRYYRERTPTPVLEIVVAPPSARVKTVISIES